MKLRLTLPRHLGGRARSLAQTLAQVKREPTMGRRAVTMQH